MIILQNKRILKEIKDYCSIFLFFVLICIMFSGNMAFGAATCTAFDTSSSNYYNDRMNRCKSQTLVPSISENTSTETLNGYKDFDNNIPITCDISNIEFEFNPDSSTSDYQYNNKRKACLAIALTFQSVSAASFTTAGYICSEPSTISKANKVISTISKVIDTLSAIADVVTTTLSATLTSYVIDPRISFHTELAISAGTLAGTAIARLISTAGMDGAAWTCLGTAVGLVAVLEGTYYASLGGQFETAKKQLRKVNVCGNDWYSYAYTEYDMQRPIREWYPQHGSFSNSYSYKLNKIISKEYNCEGFLDNLNGGGDSSEIKVSSEASACNESVCKAEIKQCLSETTTAIDTNGRAFTKTKSLSECIEESSKSCNSYCRKYIASCKPMISALDGDGICDGNEEFCKDIKSYSKNLKNRFYRETLYKGKEFKITKEYRGNKDYCFDPRLPESKGFNGLEQRYYFRGKEAAQYACNRFVYSGGGCVLGDGTVITKDDLTVAGNITQEIADSNDAKCAQAFEQAKTCCQNRATLGICVYDESANNRNNNTMCLRSADSEETDETCTLDTEGGTNPKFIAFQSPENSSDTCIKTIGYCPYDFNVAGGTVLEEQYCNGDYTSRTSCGDDYYKIWKKGSFREPTMSYGQTKNFCFYRAHCTEMGTSDYEFAEINSSRYLPKVCSDFIGDSQNLPVPFSIIDLNGTKDESKKLVAGVDFSLGEYRGFTAPIAQCIRETVYNMFNNVAGQSSCKDGSEPNDDGYCGEDTADSIRKTKICSKNQGKFCTDDESVCGVNDGQCEYLYYNYIMGEKLPDGDNIFYTIQSRLQLIIKLAAVIAIIVIGINFLLRGEMAIFDDIRKPKLIIIGMLKFAIVFYFAVGEAWQTYFYKWIDASTQYLYYKAFDLSLLDYKDYKNQAEVSVCDITTNTETCEQISSLKDNGEICKDFSYTGGEQSFTVPDNVESIKLEVWGAQGGNGKYSTGGLGGYSTGKLKVQQNDVLKIIVGGAGGSSGVAGYNGGGKGNEAGGGGGGRTEISTDDTLLIVAGGGGGGAEAEGKNGGAGGGGSESGRAGTDNGNCAGAGGKDGIGGGTGTTCNTSEVKYGKGEASKGGDIYVESGSENDIKQIVYSGSNAQTIDVPAGATKAIIEIYGANGGNGINNKSKGGKGGYAKGILNITDDIKQITVGIGSSGGDITKHNGGIAPDICACNGGAANANYDDGAGGGACSCVVVNDKVIMIAGGGGGGDYSIFSDTGGSGGGKIGGANGTEEIFGGTQNGRGNCEHIGSLQECPNNNGYGCSPITFGGGGGGGYYGGCAGTATDWAGGGGSGYIDEDILTDASMANGKNESSDGNGYARITFTDDDGNIISDDNSKGIGTGGGGAGYGGGASGSSGNSGGGGGGYVNKTILTETNGVTGSNEATGNGKARICYTNYEKVTTDYCSTSEETLKEQEITDLSIFDNGELPTGPYIISEDPKVNNNITTTVVKTYNNCTTKPSVDSSGAAIYDFSDKYDGCYFGDAKYPEGKEYLSIFDSLDCKLANYFNYGPSTDLPGILHMIILSLVWSPLALITVLLGFLIFIIMLIIVIDILYIFLMSIIAINLLIYVSPIVFPSLLFHRFESIFNKWLNYLMSFCLQFMFVIIYAGFLIGNLDNFAMGSAKYVGHDPTTGRLPSIECSGATDSILCLFAPNTSKGDTYLMGEKVGKILGLGPIISVANALVQDFTGTVFTLLKFCLIMYVLMEFLKKMPDFVAKLTNGTALNGKNISLTETMKGVKDGVETVKRGAMGILKGAGNKVSSAGSFLYKGGKAIADKVESKKRDEARSRGPQDKGGGEAKSDDKNSKSNSGDVGVSSVEEKND